MPLDPQELLINVDDLPWKPMGPGAWTKVLRVCAFIFGHGQRAWPSPHRAACAAVTGTSKSMADLVAGIATRCSCRRNNSFGTAIFPSASMSWTISGSP